MAKGRKIAEGEISKVLSKNLGGLSIDKLLTVKKFIDGLVKQQKDKEIAELEAKLKQLKAM